VGSEARQGTKAPPARGAKPAALNPTPQEKARAIAERRRNHPERTLDEILREVRYEVSGIAFDEPLRAQSSAQVALRKSGARPGPRSNRSRFLEEARGIIEASTCGGSRPGGRTIPLRSIAAILVGKLDEGLACTATRREPINGLVAGWERRAERARVPFWKLPTADLLLDGLRAVGFSKDTAHNYVKGLPRSGETAYSRTAHFADFVHECCVFDQRASISHAKLYGAYESWYERKDAHVSDLRSKRFSKKTFSALICQCNRALGGPGVKAVILYGAGRHVRGYSGIRLRES
jgi:hypothetical protein